MLEELKKRGTDNPCPLCKQNEWSLQASVVHIPIIDTHTNAISGSGIPAAMLICINCGHLSFHSLGLLGLMDLMASSTEPENHE